MKQAPPDPQPQQVLIALGSNATSKAGGPVETLVAALSQIDAGPLKILARSRFFTSPFVPAGEQPDVINAVVLCQTELSPVKVMALLHEIETDFDRSRNTRWGSRTLDLDLLLMDQKTLPDQPTVESWITMDAASQSQVAPDTLILPHPRLQDRAFVLVPAAEIAPDWHHPILNKTIAEMLRELTAEDINQMTPIDPQPRF